jgi:pimeloyl-ACP methyl ester carboxylesterase
MLPEKQCHWSQLYGPVPDSRHWILTELLGFAAPSNSYIDSAAQAGQVTFSYDRLGVGESSHPDPIQIVQGPAHVSVAHALVGLLRNGELSATKFSNVFGVGHSYGSAVTTTVAGTYPSDFDALVLTGFSDNTNGAPQFWAAQNLIPASTDLSQRFVGLEDGYLLGSTIYGLQYAFFHFPGFEIPILSQAFANGQTTTWGEQFTMEALGHPAESYTGPVFVVNGMQDLVFCEGNCNLPSNIALSTLRNVFPAANATKSGAFLLPNSGHGLNRAANAPLAFDKIQSFILQLARH